APRDTEPRSPVFLISVHQARVFEIAYACRLNSRGEPDTRARGVERILTIPRAVATEVGMGMFAFRNVRQSDHVVRDYDVHHAIPFAVPGGCKFIADARLYTEVRPDLPAIGDVISLTGVS